MSCILRHRGVQLILAFSWTRPAILVADKGRGGCFYFFCFFTFIPVSLSSPLLSLLSPFSLSLGDEMNHKGLRVVEPQHNQSLLFFFFFFFFFFVVVVVVFLYFSI